MKIKRILFRSLGIKNYLKLISKIFFISYRMNLLRKDREYECHYFVRNLISNGDHIIDIGANLGYYSVIFSRLIGRKGKVYCVEPVKLFRTVLAKNISKFPQAEIIPYALGAEDNKEIRMITPISGEHFRHGLTKVIGDEKPTDYNFFSTEKMFRPNTVFKNMEACNYIKCDVEGYENYIIPLMSDIFQKFRPILQVETSPENKKVIDNLLLPMTYKVFYVSGKDFIPLESESEGFSGDLFYVPGEQISRIGAYIKSS